MAKTQMKFKMKNIGVEDNRPEWTIKLKSVFGIDEAKSIYDASIEVDQAHFASKIDEINQRILETQKKPDMFDNGEEMIKEYKKQIKEIEKEQKFAEQMEVVDFKGSVSTVDFDKGLMTLSVVEDVALAIVKIRNNFEAYILNLS